MHARKVRCKRGNSSQSESVRHNFSRGFTLIEIIVVVAIIAVVYSLTFSRSSYAAYYRQEGFFRQLSETITFLHQRAVIDSKSYKLEFSFTENIGAKEGTSWYRVREVSTKKVAEADELFGAGALTQEIANILITDTNVESSGSPPSQFPSLRENVPFPQGLRMVDIRLRDGKITEHDSEDLPAIFFSPRGFSDFAVLHFENAEEEPTTLLVNPFTGLATIYREYKDFEWSYGRDS